MLKAYKKYFEGTISKGVQGVSSILRIFYIALAVLVVLGNDRCQENYEFGSQATVETQTPTPSQTPTVSPTPVDTSTDETGEETDETDETGGETETLSHGLFRELESIGSSVLVFKELPKSGNWLGQAYGNRELVPGVALDSDNDGYTDLLEEDIGSDPNDANSTPRVAVTSLSLRLQGVDSDADGVPNTAEAERGTDPMRADSDGDGVNDGAELRSGTDPLNPQSRPQDSDGDGLSDEFEAASGFNGQSVDTDGDRLRDDLELALACDPLRNDTDNDGVLDGKEVEIGSDPIQPEGGNR